MSLNLCFLSGDEKSPFLSGDLCKYVMAETSRESTWHTVGTKWGGGELFTFPTWHPTLLLKQT